MSKFNYTQRYISTSTIDSTDALIFDVEDSNVPKRITYTSVLNNLKDDVLTDEHTLSLMQSLIESNKETIRLLKKIYSYE